MTQRIDKTIIIEATPSAVWDTLTNPDLMKQWMAEPEIGIEVITDWKIGGPIIIKGFHHIKFENKGTVLQFEPGKVLQYNYLSSLSQLPDNPENYSIIEFKLAPLEHHTSLTLTISNLPTEIIFKHVDFYWRTTIVLLKKFIENYHNEDMDNLDDLFRELYKHFNDRKIDLVLSKMADNVKWANGMEGGFVYGQDAVRNYWTRQFTMVSSNVTPLAIEAENGIVKIKVHQIVHDLNGNLLADEFVYHFFHLQENKIALFEIGEKIKRD